MLEGVSSPQIIIDVLVRLTFTLTTIVQLCDGKEHKSGDGGGDHATWDFGLTAWGHMIGFGGVCLQFQNGVLE